MAATVILVPLCGCAGYTGLALQRFIAAEAKTAEAMRAFVDEDYPDFRIENSTHSGYVLRHRDHRSLSLDVRFERGGQTSVWGGPPRETLSDGWTTTETFFRHAEGMPVDPRTKMNYDVDGFVDAYRSLRPGRDAVVWAVWLNGKDVNGLESYIVWVTRRGSDAAGFEHIWPDHRAVFTRDSKTGTWTGTTFTEARPFQVPTATSEATKPADPTEKTISVEDFASPHRAWSESVTSVTIRGSTLVIRVESGVTERRIDEIAESAEGAREQGLDVDGYSILYDDTGYMAKYGAIY